MTKGIVPVKTPAGQAELGTRRLRLSQRHRTVLLLVDGRRTEAQIRRVAAQVGVPGTCFDELLGLSLIAMPEAEKRPEAAPAPVRAAPVAAQVVVPPVVPAVAQRPDAAPIAAPAAPPPSPRALRKPVVVEDSLLPASGTLPPDSSALDSVLGGRPPPDSWLPPESDEEVAELIDAAFDQARAMLLRAVRNEAPLFGSLTLMRLRRARSRADLRDLLDEVEAHINKRHRSLSATQILTSVRQLLARQIDSTPSLA